MGKRGTRKKTDEEWLEMPWQELSAAAKRRVIFILAKEKCTHCGFDKKRDDGHRILEVDHIDGNHKNNSQENLQVLCPNCHAMTHNFRNYGRTSKAKTSTRFRRENKGYYELRKEIVKQEQAYIEHFKQVVNETFLTKEIDYSKFGWVQRLSEKLNESNCPQIIGRRVRSLLPEFYLNSCFVRSNKKRLI